MQSGLPVVSGLRRSLGQNTQESRVFHSGQRGEFFANGSLASMCGPILKHTLSATAQTVETMIIGRLVAGLGIGISSALMPLYISEISPTEIRGALGSVNQVFICIGILAALVAGLPLAGSPLWYDNIFMLDI